MNKNVKKFFSVFLSVIMIFSLFTVTTFAEDTKTSIEASLAEDIVHANEPFFICISVKNATDLHSMDCDIRYSGEHLEFIDFAESAYAPGMCNYNYWDVGHAQFDITCADGNFTGDSEIIFAKFKADSDGEYTININVNSWQGKNQPENITFTFYVGDTDNTTEHAGFTYKVTENGVVVTSNDEKTTGNIVIPSEIDGLPVIAIGKEEFFGFSNVTSITIPATVTDIDLSTFSTCSELEKFIVDENNQYYSSDAHGVLFNKDKSELIRYPEGSSAQKYSIPNGVSVICESAFARAKKLKSIKIPATVTTIEAAAFLATWNLESIVIPDSVTKLAGNTFSNSGIKSAVLPTGINTIETRLFDKCTKLESVVIPVNITKIDDFAFSMCDNLKDVYYTGSQEDWNKITVSDAENFPLENAQIHFNYDGVVLFDVNGDGNISASDARLALRASAKLEVLEGNRFTAADVDKNGKITAADARLILRKSAKLD
ncbi:MAG: leucine-rich repeat protein [Clostridia bacterium]|nr:leucine-rich repeat protein [Clostridia bacterium]